ncbi:double-strand break repair helicase AddA [Aureimonas mangrovi]|uniref:double-strand break repair helicase AddA n=1 Tax=Aureimonas mangrovi TaxID=2758041 RepID=UPI00163D4B07|nr:double-strand break repair helicase AddA [Aureimonas mangrovi]
MSGLLISAGTKAAQALASDPSRSVFVAANAGSGKTFVLARRVVRLLIAGTAPSRILCLTYTKAAAAEMQGRIFALLAEWTRLSDEALAGRLAELGGEDTSTADLARARRLFATALETPGGLKIQTIHAFCESLLHLFPLEAQVPAHFTVMDDAESALLLAEARRRFIVAADAGAEGDEALAESFAEALTLGGEKGLDDLLAEIVQRRDAIGAHMASVGGVEGAVSALARALGLDPRADEDGVVAAAIDPPGFDDDFRERLAEALQRSSAVTDGKLAAKLAAVEAATGMPERFDALRAICLKSDGGRYKSTSVATKSVASQFDDFAERLEELADFVEETSERLATVRLFRASRAALVIAERLERDYTLLKRARARLDFEDLIVRAADLLTRAEASAWVHYKLDQGIDHVLVDEAQDTSARQWQVVRSLVEEFFEGEPERVRTVFAVGDEKQSIYSFQGASPAMFADERRRMEARATAVGAPFSRVALQQSFRSSADILRAVDGAFETEDDRRGLSAEGEKPVHETARGQAPGLVEIWPPYEKEAVPQSDDWLTPIDEEPRSSPLVRLATRIAGTIEDWIGTAIEHRGETRALHAGDVIVLVRKRSAFVGAMSAALRERGIAVAGADRLVLTDHIAVQDLVALGRVLANAEDELSLAAVLKSPLFGFSDDELMALALTRQPRGAEALRLALSRFAEPGAAARLPASMADRESLAERLGAAHSRIEALRARAGFAGVFDLYARILGPEGGRARLTARLGRDAGEVIDAFLDLALAFEAEGGADLDAFLANLDAAPPTIKRETGRAGGEVRIMTAHAAKGLEAPAVFLVDPGSAPFVHSHGARLVAFADMPGLPPLSPPGFLWCPTKALANADVERLREAEQARAEEEYRRLLYVGMTRAADRLVVCGHAGVRGAHEKSWLSRVQASLEGRCERITAPDGSLTALRWGSADFARAPSEAPKEGERPVRAIDLSKLAPEPLPPRPLVPSDPTGALRVAKEEEQAAGSPVAASPGATAVPSAAIARGIAIHKLLQVLPDMAPDEREAAARRYLALSEITEAPAREAMLASALAVLDDARFAPLFAPGSRAEVGVRGTVTVAGRPYPVSGTIDRLAVSAESVLLVDYKTNRPPARSAADLPAAYVLQLALYRALLAPLYPGREIRAALLYTEAPALIEPGEAALDASLEGLALRRAGDDARAS